MNKKLKSEKGAITLVVLVTMLFLIAFLMTLFLRVANKAQTSAETTEQIKQKYNNLEDEETIYQSYFADEEVIPIYTVEQLKKIGSGEQVEVEQEKKIYIFKKDGYYVLKNNLNLGGKYDEETNTPGGIGEEDIVYLVLPYIHSAREGVLRLGSLLEKYGTYEMNGIAFSDHDEIWWLETIGGHHWIARRVPDDAYVVMPNQLGIDTFDLKDAFTTKENHLCSDYLKEFIEKNAKYAVNLDY